MRLSSGWRATAKETGQGETCNFQGTVRGISFSRSMQTGSPPLFVPVTALQQLQWNQEVAFEDRFLLLLGFGFFFSVLQKRRNGLLVYEKNLDETSN